MSREDISQFEQAFEKAFGKVSVAGFIRDTILAHEAGQEYCTDGILIIDSWHLWGEARKHFTGATA